MNTDFENQLAEYRQLIEKTLPDFIPADIPEPLRSAMSYSLLNGGKRIRGVMLLAAYRMLKEDVTPALPFACAIEMVHAYSLIHDDLPAMDNDDYRRGKLTCHKVYGEGMAVLAGDGLLSLAFETILGSKHPMALQAGAELANRCGTRGMVAGQCADLNAEKVGGDEKVLEYIHLHKTSDLLTAPVVIGLLLADADAEMLNEAREYGKNIGIAFQIIDDILDVVGDKEQLGKSIGKDREENKCTWVTLHGIEKAKLDADFYTQKAASAFEKHEKQALFLKTLAQSMLYRVK